MNPKFYSISHIANLPHFAYSSLVILLWVGRDLLGSVGLLDFDFDFETCKMPGKIHMGYYKYETE